MRKLFFILLIPSVLWGQTGNESSVSNILKKYKNIKEEMKDRRAIVTSSDAVIFADVALEYPVHKLKKGEILNLANFEVKLENVFPILINGGVGYIRAGDIEVQKVFSNPAASRLDQHNVDHFFEQGMTTLDGRTNFLLKYASFSAGSNWADFSDLASDKAQNIIGYQFLVEFQPRSEYFGFGVGPSFYHVAQSNINLSTWAFEGEIYITPFKFSLFQWDLHLGAGFSSGLDIEIAGVEGINKGYFYSWNLGTKIRFFPESKIGLVGGLNYRSWSISGMKDVLFLDGTLADLNGFSGADFFLGLSYKF